MVAPKFILAMSKLKVTYIDNSATQYDEFADEIIYSSGKKSKGKLYLGDRHSCAMVQLKHRNISAVVNCDTDLFGLAKEKEIRYLKVDPSIDHDDPQKCFEHAFKIFEISFKFLDQELASGHNVLVHCEKGITKSASIVIYFLMKKLSVSLAQAFKEVKKYRSIVLPQPSLFRHLISAEINLRGVESIRIQGRQVVYLESAPVTASRRIDPAADGKAAERYFILGVVASVVIAIFGGIYLIAGKI